MKLSLSIAALAICATATPAQHRVPNWDKPVPVKYEKQTNPGQPNVPMNHTSAPLNRVPDSGHGEHKALHPKKG